MDQFSGSYNAALELNEANLNQIGENYQIPRIELSKSHHDKIEPKVKEGAPNEGNGRIFAGEKGSSNLASFSNISKSKYIVEPVSESLEEEDYSLLSFFSKHGKVHQFVNFFKNNKRMEKLNAKIIASVVILTAYIAFLIAVLIIETDSENDDYWCESDGLLIVISCIVFIMVIYFKVLKPLLVRVTARGLLDDGMKDKLESLTKVYKWRYTIPSIYLVVISCIVIFLIIDTANERSRLISALGIIVFLLFGFLFSSAPRKIVWRHIIWGIGLQFMCGLIVLRWPVGRKFIQCLGYKIDNFLAFSDHGATFVFQGLVSEDNIFAFKILSVILFVNLCIQILYYYGVMQWFVIKLGWILQVTVGTTVCESVNAAANIFLGMTEAPLIIKPYMHMMTNSELHAVLTGGFATVSGTVLAAYISFGVNPAHLLTASVMSAPAALGFSKLFYPEVEISCTKAGDIEIIKSGDENVLHAAIEGVSSAIPLVATILANLIAFIAFIAFIDAFLSWPCELIGLAEGTCSMSNFFGYIFTPVAWIMGVPWIDCYNVGQLIGTKTVINEFVAYIQLGEFIKQSRLSPRSITIVTYALCGFANFTSIGIQLGSLGTMVPERKADLTKLALRSMIAGTIACFLTACVAGILISSDTESIPHTSSNLI